MTDAQIYALKQSAALKQKTEVEIFNSARFITLHPEMGPKTVSEDGTTVGGGNGSFTVNNVKFAQQAVLHPENFVTSFMNFVAIDPQVQLDGDTVADSVIASIVAGNLGTVWK